MINTRVIIAGSRTFNDYALLMQTISDHFPVETTLSDIEIVSGTARGADQLGERFAHECNFICTRFPADWDKYGSSAGYRRNEQMAKYATHLIAFWDGESRGTKHMIDLATKYNLRVRIIDFQPIILPKPIIRKGL